MIFVKNGLEIIFRQISGNGFPTDYVVTPTVGCEFTFRKLERPTDGRPSESNLLTPELCCRIQRVFAEWQEYLKKTVNAAA